MDFIFLKKFELFRNLTSQSDCMEKCRYTHIRDIMTQDCPKLL